jgi:hypothetical protein
MRSFVLAAAVIAALFVTSTAGAAEAPTALPAVERTLTAGEAVKRTCADELRRGAAGVAVTSYRAPMSGFVTTRLAAGDASDWDLALFDAAGGRRVAASQGFQSGEVAQAWVKSGQELVLQGCRRSGTDGSASVPVRAQGARRGPLGDRQADRAPQAQRPGP